MLLVCEAVSNGERHRNRGQERVERVRVELATPLCPHRCDYLVDRNREPVDAIADQRVEDVGDGDDPAGERNRLTRETTWIAAAAEPLMVRPGNLGAEVEQRLARTGEDAVAALRVGLDDETLGGAEWPRLAQDVVGNGDLADVVERARDPEQLAPVIRES